MMRSSVLPILQKCGAKRAHSLEITSLAWVEVIQRSSEAMMSGSACEAAITVRREGEKKRDLGRLEEKLAADPKSLAVEISRLDEIADAKLLELESDFEQVDKDLKEIKPFKVISEAITSTCHAAQQSVHQEDQAMQTSQDRIVNVLENFRNIASGLIEDAMVKCFQTDANILRFHGFTNFQILSISKSRKTAIPTCAFEAGTAAQKFLKPPRPNQRFGRDARPILLRDGADNPRTDGASAFANCEAKTWVHSDWSNQLNRDGYVVAWHNHFSAFWKDHFAGHVSCTEVELWTDRKSVV